MVPFTILFYIVRIITLIYAARKNQVFLDAVYFCVPNPNFLEGRKYVITAVNQKEKSLHHHNSMRINAE
jgi:hypothetical protein